MDIYRILVGKKPKKLKKKKSSNAKHVTCTWTNSKNQMLKINQTLWKIDIFQSLKESERMYILASH